MAAGFRLFQGDSKISDVPPLFAAVLLYLRSTTTTRFHSVTEMREYSLHRYCCLFLITLLLCSAHGSAHAHAILVGKRDAAPSRGNKGNALLSNADNVRPEHTTEWPGTEPRTLSLEFIPNQGQLVDESGMAMPKVRFFLDAGNVKFYFGEHSMSYVFENRDDTAWRSHRVDCHFEGSEATNLAGDDRSEGWYNYYYAWCAEGITRVPGYRKLVYQNLYPNIDLVFYITNSSRENPSKLKYDFVVHPGGDPKAIRLRFEGATSLDLEEAGLRISTPLGHVTEAHPRSFQGRQAIPSHYALDGSSISFTLGEYDPRVDLVIDPPRLWGTYFPGDSINLTVVYACTDRVGNVFVASDAAPQHVGIATAGAHQTAHGSPFNVKYDAIVGKFSSAGLRLWTTYYGGTDDDHAVAMATGPDNSAILVGYTESPNAIATSGSHQSALASGQSTDTSDAFLAKFDSNGVRLWASYLGGVGYDVSDAVAVDSTGAIYVGGKTFSDDGIATSGGYRTTRENSGSLSAFFTKFNAAGVRQWGTYYVGASAESIECDIDGNIYVVSFPSNSPNNYATAGAWQTTRSTTLLTKFSGAGSRLWATYCMGTCTTPGGGDIYRRSLAVSRRGVYIARSVHSACPGISTPGSHREAYLGTIDAGIQKFTLDGQIVWGSYFGDRTGDDIPFAIVTDKLDNLFFGGSTTSFEGLATENEYQTTNTSPVTAFLGKFDSTGRLRWATFYGKAGIVNGLGMDPAGHLLGGGNGHGEDYSSESGWKKTPGGGFLFKFCDTTFVNATVGRRSFCEGFSTTLSTQPGFADYQWLQDGVAIPGATSTTYTVPQTTPPGRYRYTVLAADPEHCAIFGDAGSVWVQGRPFFLPMRDTSVCIGSTIQIGKLPIGEAPPFKYNWTPTTGLNDPKVARPLATPTSTTKYYVTVTDTNGCTLVDSVTVKVNQLPKINLGNSVSVCKGSSVVLGKAATGGNGQYKYRWSPFTGLNRTDTVEVVATPDITTTYLVRATDKNGCVAEDSVQVIVFEGPQIADLRDSIYCALAPVRLNASATGGVPPLRYKWAPSTGLSDATAASPIASPAQTTDYTVVVTDQNDCSTERHVKVVTFAASAGILGPTSTCPTAIDSYRSRDSASSTFEWSLSGGGIIASGQGTSAIDVEWQQEGDWRLSLRQTMTDGTCTRDTFLMIRVENELHPQLTFEGPLTICTGDSIVLKAVGYKTHRWSTGSTADSIVVTQSGQYSVRVTNAAGCEGVSDQLTVDVRPDLKPEPHLKLSGTSICDGDSVNLSTTGVFSEYLWSTGERTPGIVARVAGMYWVTVKNASGCEGKSEAVTIRVAQSPDVHLSANGPTTICEGDSVTLQATGGSSYTWTRDNQILTSTTDKLITGVGGSFRVLARNDEGCESLSDEVWITVRPRPVLTISGPGSVCDSARATYSLNDTSSASIEWRIEPPSLGTLITGQGGRTVVVRWGSSAVGVISALRTTDGCTYEARLPISIDKQFVPVVTSSGPLEFCEGESVVLEAEAGLVAYSWKKDGLEVARVAAVKINEGGDYVLTVESADGCPGMATLSVRVNPLPPIPQITQLGSALRSTPAMQYRWLRDGVAIDGGVEKEQALLGPGSYRVIITDSNGCMSESDAFDIGGGSAVITISRGLEAEPGDQLLIPLELESSSFLAESGVRDFVARIRFDPNVVQPIGIPAAPSGDRQTVTFGGDVAFSKGILATVPFFVLNTDSVCSTIEIDTFYFPGAPIELIARDGRVCVLGPCLPQLGQGFLASQAWIAPARPNPARSILSLEYHVPVAGDIQLGVQDILGRVSLAIREGHEEAGVHTARVDISTLPSGFYRIVLRSPGNIFSRALEIVN